MPFFTFTKTSHPVALLGKTVIYLNKDRTGMLQESKGRSFRSLKLDRADETFEMMPLPDKSEEDFQVYFIAGASGSGKSYLAKGLAEKYRKQNPDNDVYLISKLEKDNTLDQLNPPAIRLKLEKLLMNPPEYKDFENCMVILDDIEGVSKKEETVLQELIDKFSTLGRHTHCRPIVIRHLLTDRNKTRTVLGEATNLIVFPESTHAKSFRYLLDGYFGLEKKQIEELKKCGSRWVMIHTHYPLFILTEKELYFLN